MSKPVPSIPAPTTALRFSTATLAVSSGAFAAATLLELLDAAGPSQAGAIALAVLGFTALLAATVGGPLIAFWRAQFFRRTAAETYRSTELSNAIPDRPNLTDSSSDEPSAPSPVAHTGLPEPSQPPTEQEVVTPVSLSTAIKTHSWVWRYAGPHDLHRIARAGKDVIGEDLFYDASELGSYLASQRDAIRCLVDPNPSNASNSLRGYALLLALKPITVERIKAGRIARGRDILPSDLAQSLADTDALYIGMLHGFDRLAQLDVARHVVQVLNAADEKRRPQLILAREGTPDGGLLMRELQFSSFGDAPYIKAAFTDGDGFRRESRKRLIHHEPFGTKTN